MKYDIKTARKDLYAPPSDDFVRVEVPLMPYLAMDGHGDPNTSPEYADAVAALFSVAYATKFATKARAGFDFVVGPLEGLWSSSDPAAFTRRDKASWDWTMLIPLPAEVTDADVAAGLAKAAKSKPGLPIDRVRRFDLDEGVCLQIMHVGSYDAETPTLARLHHEVMPARGLAFNGRHHEIYLSDPQRTAPEKLRTVLRQPVGPTAS